MTVNSIKIDSTNRCLWYVIIDVSVVGRGEGRGRVRCKRAGSVHFCVNDVGLPPSWELRSLTPPGIVTPAGGKEKERRGDQVCVHVCVGVGGK